jgi:hypothetical protein
MRHPAYSIRFFWMVAPVPRLMVQAMVGVGALAAVLLVVDRERSARALVPLLLLQVFAASSGFMVPARRGHYDLLLTGGYSRMHVAAVHWVVSVLPGVVVWLAVAALDLVMTRGVGHASHGSGTLVAMTLVSTVPWAATVALPRFTAAIAWLLLAAVAAAILPSDEARILVDPLDARSWAAVSTGITLNPVALIGIDITGARALNVAPAVILSAGSILAALTWIGRHDIPLEAAQ